MDTHTIKKGSSNLKPLNEISKIRVNDSRPDAPICGVLNYIGQNGDTYTYQCVGRGCVTIYLTDCQGNVEASEEYNCIPPNNLQVEGCHSIGCGCG